MRNRFLVLVVLVSIVAAGCVAPTPQVIEKEKIVEKPVVQTVVVEQTVQVEKKSVETVVVKEVVTPTPGPKQVVTLWTRTMPPAMAKFMEEVLFPNFYAENPNVEIKWEQFPVAEFNEKIISAIATGASGPDVVNLADQRVYVLAEAGALDAITDDVLPWLGYPSTAALEADYLPAGIDYASWDGALYGLGDELSSHAFYINTEHFAEAGLDPKTVDLSTWDKVAEVAKLLAKKDASGTIIREGFDAQITGLAAHTLNTLDTMVKLAGGSLVTADSTQCTLDTPEVQKAMETFKMLLVDNDTGGVKAGQAGSVGMIRDACSNGTVSMWFTNPAAVIVLCEAEGALGKGKWMSMPFPTFDGEIHGATAWGWVWVVSKNAANRELSWKLVKALASEAELHAQRTAFIQPIKWLVDSDVLREMPVVANYWPQADASSIAMKSTHYAEIEPLVLACADRILLEGEDIANVLKDCNAQCNTIMSGK